MKTQTQQLKEEIHTQNCNCEFDEKGNVLRISLRCFQREYRSSHNEDEYLEKEVIKEMIKPKKEGKA